MVQIIEENRKPTFVERLGIPRIGENLGQGVSHGYMQRLQENRNNQMEANKQNRIDEAIKRLTDKDVSGLSPEMKTEFLKQFGQGELQSQSYIDKLRGKQKEKVLKEKSEISNYEGALNAVNEMRNLRTKGNLGFFSHARGLVSPDTREDRGKYETLGNSLISYASQIPIRNKLEFEKLAGRISDPSTTDSEAKGILDALEQIIQSSLKQYENDEIDLGTVKIPTQTGASRTIDINSMKEIYEEAKGDKNRALEIARKRGYVL